MGCSSKIMPEGRDRRCVAAAIEHARFDEIKDLKNVVNGIANDGQIDAAAVAVVGGGVTGLVIGHIAEIAGLEQRTAHGSIEFSAHRQHAVADGLDFQTAPMKAPQ